jgi:hypothetical protein
MEKYLPLPDAAVNERSWRAEERPLLTITPFLLLMTDDDCGVGY